MNFEYSEEEKMLRKTVKELFKDKYPIFKVREFMNGGRIDGDLKNLLATQGLLGLNSNKDEEENNNIIHSVLISYEAGRALLPFPLIENHVSSYVLNKYHQKMLFNELETGEKMMTIAWEADDHFAKQKDDLFIANGYYSYVPFAIDSDFMLVKINISNEQESIVLVDLNNENVSISKRESMDETYPLFTVVLRNYRFSENDIISKTGNGELIFNEMKRIASLLICAEMIGGCEEILAKTVTYANERKQFGQPISKFQAIKHMAAEMYLLLESGKAALDYATWAMASNNEEESRKVIPLLKSYVSEASNELIGTAIQVHGGIGFTWESDVHLFYKRARRSSVMLGDSYSHNEYLMKHILEEAK